MAANAQALIPSVADADLEYALRERLSLLGEPAGSLGEFESLAVRMGLIQGVLQPRFELPHLLVFAADHGLAVDNIAGLGQRSTAQMVEALLSSRSPLPAWARLNGLQLLVVDSGIAEAIDSHPDLLARKIAHGTRNSRVGTAMSLEQVHAAMRAGMEIGDSLSGDAIACAGIGVGSMAAAALLVSCAADVELDALLDAEPGADAALVEHLALVLGQVRSRHSHLTDRIEVLAAVGGFEVAMLAGTMLAAAARRRLIVVDGMAACAAVLVARSIAPAVVDYCVFVRSNPRSGLDRALALLDVRAWGEPGLDSVDGCGAALVWPRLRAAAALLTDVADRSVALSDRVNPTRV